MTDKLALYNGALRILGQRKLASLTEASNARYLLDDVWNDGCVDYVLSQGSWNFALRTVKVDYNPDITASFGRKYAFDRPTDYIRLVGISVDDFFANTLENYDVDGDYFWVDTTPIYLRYVSNGNDYGGDLSRWTSLFAKYVEAYLAFEIYSNLTTGVSIKKSEVEQLMVRRRSDARNKDALEETIRKPPTGTWVRARRYGGSAKVVRADTVY